MRIQSIAAAAALTLCALAASAGIFPLLFFETAVVAPSIVQCVPNSQSATGTSISATISSVAAGDYLEVWTTGSGNNTQLLTPTDGVNTYATGNITEDTVDVQTLARYYTNAAVAGGSYTVQANFSTSLAAIGVLVCEITGTTGPIASLAGNYQASPGTGVGAVTTSASGTLSGTPALLTGLTITTSGAASITAAGGSTLHGTGWSAIKTAFYSLETQALSSTASVSAQFTSANGNPQVTIGGVWGAGGGGGGCSGVPAPAAAVGFCTLTFSSTTLGTTTGTWQNCNWYSQPSSGITQNGDGSITINIPSTAGGNSFNANLCTAVYNGSFSPAFQGIAFYTGGYFCALLSYTGTPPGYTVAGWPSWWSLAVEWQIASQTGSYSAVAWPGQSQPYVNYLESDFFEALVPGSATTYEESQHDWYGVPGSISEVSQGQTPIGSGAFTTPRWVCEMRVPATSTTQGYSQAYLDHTSVGSQYFWNQYSSANGPPPVNGTTAYSIGDNQHFDLILGNSYNSNTTLPFTIHQIAVYQLSSSNNIVH